MPTSRFAPRQLLPETTDRTDTAQLAPVFDKLGALTKARPAAILLLAMLALSARAAITVSADEMAQKNRWVEANLLSATNLPPFSFVYQGQRSSALLPSWRREQTDTILDSNRRQHVITWSRNGLQVRCVAVEHSDYPTAEWTVYLKNSGTSNTPILEGIQALNTSFQRGAESEFVLNGMAGDCTTATTSGGGYEPYRLTLGPNVVKKFAPIGGKSSAGAEGWPYYNLQRPGGGIILAIGWPGQWASSFARDASNGLRVQAGQELTHLFLKPGEEIRTPMIQLFFWEGTSVVRAQNLWRHFYMAHIIPRLEGQPPSPLAQIQVGGEDTGQVKAFIKAGIQPDLCWRDAGWCPVSTNGPGGNGTWEVDTHRYPLTFKPFTDWVHAQGMKFVLWFEPERIDDNGSWLKKNHPEWLFPGTSGPSTTVGDILNEGDPVVFNWLTNHFDTLIKSQGIDWYREDMNGNGPLPAWRNHDTRERQGITENFYVQNHLAFWDALLAMNPGLRLDSCASGGRRNDLESMRRAVPLLRSDFQWPSMTNVVDGNQCQTYTLSFWLPFQGSGVDQYDPYSYRSFYMASFGMGGLTAENAAAQRQAYAECKKIAPSMLFGDYYPLTPYSLADTAWLAWQFNRADTGEGCVQAFRRGKCGETTQTFRLNDLEPGASYEVTNFDLDGSIKRSGKELMEKGLTIEIKERPGAAVIAYKRIGTPPRRAATGKVTGHSSINAAA